MPIVEIGTGAPRDFIHNVIRHYLGFDLGIGEQFAFQFFSSLSSWRCSAIVQRLWKSASGTTGLAQVH